MSKSRRIIWGVVAALAVILILEILTPLSFVIAVVIGIVIGVAVTIILLARSRGEDPADMATEVVHQAVRPDPGAKERLIHERLVRLNELLRLDGGLAIETVSAVEKLIDSLREVAPRAQREATSSETTFDLVRLATEHLPKLVNDYTDLSPSDREDRRDGFVGQIDKLTEHVRKIQDFLEQGQLHEFEAASGFVDIKFNQ